MRVMHTYYTKVPYIRFQCNCTHKVSSVQCHDLSFVFKSGCLPQFQNFEAYFSRGCWIISLLVSCGCFSNNFLCNIQVKYQTMQNFGWINSTKQFQVVKMTLLQYLSVNRLYFLLFSTQLKIDRENALCLLLMLICQNLVLYDTHV